MKTIENNMTRSSALDFQRSNVAKLVGMSENPRKNPDDIIGYVAKLRISDIHSYYEIIYFTVCNNTVYRHDVQWDLQRVNELLANHIITDV